LATLTAAAVSTTWTCKQASVAVGEQLRNALEDTSNLTWPEAMSCDNDLGPPFVTSVSCGESSVQHHSCRCQQQAHLLQLLGVGTISQGHKPAGTTRFIRTQTAAAAAPAAPTIVAKATIAAEATIAAATLTAALPFIITAISKSRPLHKKF
jgi:hypothetical protein